MTERTREEINADIEHADSMIEQYRQLRRSANIELAKFKASDKEEANKQLAHINEQMQELWSRARELVNEFHLEFYFEDIEGYDSVEMDIYHNGMWAHSSC